MLVEHCHVWCAGDLQHATKGTVMRAKPDIAYATVCDVDVEDAFEALH